MSLEEPTMIGPTPEDRARAAKRTKRLRIAAAVVVVVIAVAIGISLIPTPASTTVYVDPFGSACAPGASFRCTIILEARPGSVITTANVKSVQINGTDTTSSVKQSGQHVSVTATVPLVPMENCPPDIGCAEQPPTIGDVTVFLTDGTQVSVILGEGGILSKN